MTLDWHYYRRRLARAMPWLLAVSVLLAALAYGAVERVGPVHEVHFSYLVSLAEREMTEEFQFEGYYALQATDLFTATLAAWLQAPEVVAAAYTEAEIPLEGRTGYELVRQVRVEKAAAQLVRVTVRENTAGRAERLARGLRTVMERNISTYHQQGLPMLTFRAVPLDSWSSVSDTGSGVAATATFIFSFLILVNGVLLWLGIRGISDEPDIEAPPGREGS